MEDIRRFESSKLDNTYETNLNQMASVEATLFGHELMSQKLEPPAGDTRIAAYCEAAHEMLTSRNDPTFWQALHSMLKSRMELRLGLSPNEVTVPPDNVHIESRSYHVNRFLRSLQRPIFNLRHYFPDYISSLDTPQPWRKLIDMVLEPDTMLNGAFTYDFVHRDVQSNVSERYKGPMLVAKLMPERFIGPISVLDIGCSQNQGLKRWSMMHNDLLHHLKFGAIGTGHLKPDANGENVYAADANLTELFNRMLKDGLPLKSGLGVDIEDVANPDSRAWAKACSFYPSELLPPDPHSGQMSKEERYDLIEEATLENVGFFHGDFSALDTTAFEQTSPDQKYDLVVFSTVMYLTSKDQQARMLETAKQYLKPDGLIVVQDFLHLDEHRNLVFEESWFQKPYPYRTLVLDADKPDEGFREVFRWKNGRCTELALGADAGQYGLPAAA